MINGKTTKNIADKCQSAKKIGNNIDVDPKCPERSLILQLNELKPSLLDFLQRVFAKSP